MKGSCQHCEGRRPRTPGVLVAATALLVLLFLSQAWPQYQWASLLNQVESYESFVKRFPDDKLTGRARAKIYRLKDDGVWASAAAAGTMDDARRYLRLYPHGKHRNEARLRLGNLIDEEWRQVAAIPYESKIREFLATHPDAPPQTRAEAEDLISRLIGEAWRRAALTRSEAKVTTFLKRNPEAPAQVIAEAKALLAELAQEDRWKQLAGSRSAAEIRAFLLEHPQSPHRGDLEARLAELSDDWDWVREQDTLEPYRHFLSRFPEHPLARWIEKRIIDLEVTEIAAGDHGEIPQVEARRLGGSAVGIEVKNDTGYTLTLRYSGPDSVKLVIPVGQTGKLTLPPGRYRVAGSVAALGVNNYYGGEMMEGGAYSCNFFIEQYAGRQP